MCAADTRGRSVETVSPPDSSPWACKMRSASRTVDRPTPSSRVSSFSVGSSLPTDIRPDTMASRSLRDTRTLSGARSSMRSASGASLRVGAAIPDTLSILTACLTRC